MKTKRASFSVWMAAVVENSNGLRPCRFCPPPLSLLHQRENETVQILLKENVKKSPPLKELSSSPTLHVQKEQSMLSPSRAKRTKHAWSIMYKKNKGCLVHHVQKEQSMLGPSR